MRDYSTSFAMVLIIQKQIQNHLELLAKVRLGSKVVLKIANRFRLVFKQNTALVGDVAAELANMVRHSDERIKFNAMWILILLKDEFPEFRLHHMFLMEDDYYYHRLDERIRNKVKNRKTRVRKIFIIIFTIPGWITLLPWVWEYIILNFGINHDYMRQLGIHSSGLISTVVNWVFRYLRSNGILVQAVTLLTPLIGLGGVWLGVFPAIKFWKDPNSHKWKKFWGLLVISPFGALVGFLIILFSFSLTRALARALIGYLGR